MIKEITGCKNCPFKVTDIDIMENPCDTCNLIYSKMLKDKKVLPFEEYFIPFTKKGIVKSKNKLTLNNCPLLKEHLLIILKEK